MVRNLLLAFCFIVCNPNYKVAAVDSQMVNFCQLVDNNDLRELKRQIRKSQLTGKLIATAIECSNNRQFLGGNLLRLAISSGSHEVAIFLIKSTSSRLLNKADKDGLTLLQWSMLYHEDNAAAEAIISELKLKVK